MQWPSYPQAADGYVRDHPTYQESPSSYESWLHHEDREVDMKQYKADQERRDRLEKVTQVELLMLENQPHLKALEGAEKL